MRRVESQNAMSHKRDNKMGRKKAWTVVQKPKKGSTLKSNTAKSVPKSVPLQADKNRPIANETNGTTGKMISMHAKSSKGGLSIDPGLARKIYDCMIRSRVLEERLIKMYKQSDGYFWIGGPGEEAFNVPLGMLGKKGEGKDYDYWHMHYRSSAIMVAMGMEPIDALRQMKNTASDPFSGGRNFSNHYSRREWNVVPVSSTIETQYLSSIGTGIAQKRHGGTGITIVNGGDAGSAEGDFASCLIWSSRPGNELPILIVVTNNCWGISTSYDTQHGETQVSDRGKAFGIRSLTIDGNDVETSYNTLKECMDYIRKERKPVLLEARVSRLFGHSSASGANFVSNEEDPLSRFELRLEETKTMKKEEMQALRQKYETELLEIAKQVKQEPLPTGDTIYDNVYFKQKGKYW